MHSNPYESDKTSVETNEQRKEKFGLFEFLKCFRAKYDQWLSEENLKAIQRLKENIKSFESKQKNSLIEIAKLPSIDVLSASTIYSFCTTAQGCGILTKQECLEIKHAINPIFSGKANNYPIFGEKELQIIGKLTDIGINPITN
jgi:hypothetical protein